MIRRLFIILLMPVWLGASAQELGLKTNLAYDATLTPNLGLEVELGRRLTGQVFYGLNPWQSREDKKARHWVMMPELRYWFCQPWSGHFVGIHALGGQFNLAGVRMPSLEPFSALDDVRHHHYEGYYVGAGLTYGYQWILSRHWNVELSIGLGYTYLNYKKYQCTHCGYLEEDGDTHYLGPTKEVLSLIYVF